MKAFSALYLRFVLAVILIGSLTLAAPPKKAYVGVRKSQPAKSTSRKPAPRATSASKISDSSAKVKPPKASVLTFSNQHEKVLADPIVGFATVDSRPTRVLDLMQPEIVMSSFESIDQAFLKYMATHKYDTKFPGQVETGVNTDDFEVNLLTDLAAGKFYTKTFNARRAIFHRQIYGIAGEPKADAYINAAKKGLGGIHVAVDLNRCMTLEAKRKGTKFWDLTEKDFDLDNPMSQFVLKLLKNGFKWGSQANYAKTGKFGYYIYSSALLPNVDEQGNDKIADIFHLKDGQLAVYDNKDNNKLVDAMSFHTSWNETEANRENAGWVDADFQASIYRLQKGLDIEDVLRQGGEIWQTPSRPPRRIVTKDGTYQEISYTDGKYNPNDRWSESLKRIARGEGSLDHFYGVHFAPTDKDAVDAFQGKWGKDATGKWAKIEPGILDSNPTPNITTIVENKFATTHSWGVYGYFSGYDVKRPRQPVIWGMGYKNRVNVKDYVFQGPNDSDQEEQNADGAPVGHILHQKTTIIFLKAVLNALNKPDAPKDLQDLMEAYMDSLNASNHYANQEVQTKIVTRASSWIAQALKESVEQLIEVYSQGPKHWVVRGEVGILRDSIGRFIGHPAREIPLETMDQIMSLARQGDYRAADKIIMDLARVPSSFKEKPDLNTVEKKLDQLIRFAEWNLKSGTGKPLYVQQLQSVAMALISKPDDISWNLKAALGRIYWGDGADQKVQEAWKIIDAGVDMPVSTRKSNGSSGDASGPATKDAVKASLNEEILEATKDLPPSKDRTLSFIKCVEGMENAARPTK